ncbi:MAG: hypothetical protein ABSG51_13100 [Terracidiphilus sp.]|jgi:hypothetical protein
MKHMLLFVAASALLTGSLFAQSAPATPATAPNKPTVNQRRENQQDRIANGVGSGQLTAGGTKNLESREANLNREIKDDRQADGGKLTQSEHKQVNQQQNNLSKSIYTDKHNAATQDYKGAVGARQTNQQQRIAQGIRSGQLSANETSHLENREQGINQQVRADRQANGGKLSGSEKSQINGQQNGASRKIYQDKHNAATQPK